MRFSRILLVNPPNVKQGGYTPSPLGLLYLAAYIRNKTKARIAIVDAALLGQKELVHALTSFQPNLVGISSLTPGRLEAVAVARLAKHMLPACKTVLGGIHPTLMWQQILDEYPEVDYIVRGEGEETLYDLVIGKSLPNITGLAWRKNNRPLSNPDRKLISDLNTIPAPAWDLIDPRMYPPWGKGTENGINLEIETRYPIIFSRGCMACCTFCSSWKVWKGYRYRKGVCVADEMELLVNRYGAKHFVFYDDTLTGNEEEIINFCKEVVKRRLHVAIHGTTRIDKVSLRVLQWMKKAGFYEIAYGIESGSPHMLTRINKRTNLNLIVRGAKLTKKAGLKFCALMMFGLPRETSEDRELTDKLLKKIKPDSIGSIGEVWIFPGTALYEQAKNAHLLDDQFWLTNKPYYIYRGGIGNDPINWPLRLKDAWTFRVRNTKLESPTNLFFARTKHLKKRLTISYLFRLNRVNHY